MEYNRIEIEDFPEAPKHSYWKLEHAKRPSWGTIGTQYYKLTLVTPDKNFTSEEFASIGDTPLIERAANLWWKHEKWKRDSLLEKGPVEIVTTKSLLKGGEILG